jgi:L-fuconolactonase
VTDSKIDSHHHLWQYDAEQYPWIDESMSILKRNFSVDDLESETESNGVVGCVAVQARQTIDETDWLLKQADRTSRIRGVVGWVPLAASDEELIPLLDRFCQHPKFKGVRHVVQDEPDEKFLLRNGFSRGVSQLRNRGLVYDILIYARQLPMAAALVDRHPNQVFVLDHIAKPTISESRFDADWAANLRQLAKRSNVACKFSGVVTEVTDPQWNVEMLRPYWETMFEAFGPARIMFGSDWPVCLLRSRYDQWIQCVASLSEGLSTDQRRRFWHDNAVDHYKL